MRDNSKNGERIHLLHRFVTAFVTFAMFLAVAIVGGASARSAWADDDSLGADIGDAVTSVTIQKESNGQWQDATEVTTDDNVRAKVVFKGADAALIKSNGNKAYIKIDGPIDCSSFLGQKYTLRDTTYETLNPGLEPGTYSYVKQDDGWYVVMSFTDGYMEYAGPTVAGNFNLNMNIVKDQYPDDGKTETIKIGNGEGSLTIKPGKSSEDDKDANYDLVKSASKLRYSEDKKTAYYDYTVTLTVKNDMAGPISMTDTLTGKGWNYVDGSWKISGEEYLLSAKLDKTDNSASFVIGQVGQTIKAGTYTIQYSVYTNIESDVYKTNDNNIVNRISIDGTNKWARVTKKNLSQTIDKKGSYSNDEITWTVTLNKGAQIVQYLNSPAHFTDTIPDGLVLDGDVEVKQFDANGQLQGTTTATVNGNTITYDTPTGQYYYVITYKTKVSGEAEIPIGGKDFVNTGTTTGGLDGTHSGTVTVPSKVVFKTRSSQSVTSENEKTFATDTWETKIDVHGSLAGYVYTDYAEEKWATVKNSYIISPITMSDEQRNAIVVKDSAGNVIDPSKYAVERYEHMSQGVDTGLFKLTFGEDVTGPVTVSYKTTTVDVSLFQNDTAKNWAIITDGEGHTDSDFADTEKVEIVDTTKLIRKLADKLKNGNPDNVDVDLGADKSSLPWTLWINQGKTLTDDLTVTDTLPEGTTLDEDTLQFYVAATAKPHQSDDDVEIKGTTGHPEQITYTYDAATRKLAIRVPKDAYVVNGTSLMIVVKYKTPITDSDLLSSDKGFTKQDRIKFTNNVTLDQGGTKTSTTFTENVKRYAVDKHGTYDQASDKLNYSIVLNPDGARLNNGDLLTVKDTLDAGAWKGKVSLDSVKLFTAVNVDGKIQPGALVKEFTAGDRASLDAYQYDSSTNSFTIKIADSTGYVLVTSYSVLDADAVASDIKINNTVELQGQQTWNKKDQSSTIKASTSGEVSTGEHFLLVKHDKALFNKTLAGASYTLESYVNGTWSNATTLTTNENGQALYPGNAISQGIRNMLYRLVETKAPSGYKLDSKPYYFYLVDTDGSFTVPDSVAGDADYEPSQVVEYRLAKDKNAMLILDRYDEEDNEPQSGQIRVTKVWGDENGNRIDDPVALTKMPTVRVTLTKHVITADGGTSDTVIGRKQLNAGNNWTCTWNDLSTSENVTYSVTEDAVEGYRASYKLDGRSSSGLNFTLRQEGDLVEVTNIPKSNATTLPSTGGIGDGWFVAGGALTVLTACFGLAETCKNAKRGKSLR